MSTLDIAWVLAAAFLGGVGAWLIVSAGGLGGRERGPRGAALIRFHARQHRYPRSYCEAAPGPLPSLPRLSAQPMKGPTVAELETKIRDEL